MFSGHPLLATTASYLRVINLPPPSLSLSLSPTRPVLPALFPSLPIPSLPYLLSVLSGPLARIYTLAGLPFLVIETSAVQPYRRGFYCDDESIRYPAKSGEIVSDTLLSATGILISILSVSHLSLITNVIFTPRVSAPLTSTSSTCGSHVNSHANLLLLLLLLFAVDAILCLLSTTMI